MIQVIDRYGEAATYDADSMTSDRDGLYLTKSVDGRHQQVAMYNGAAWQSASIVSRTTDA